MLQQMAFADAYGCGFEYAHTEYIRNHNDVKRYYKHPRHNKPAGEYSDDTQMSLAIMELMIDEKKGQCNWTPLEIANKFVEVYKRCPVKGYAKRFQQLLDEISDGQELLDRIIPNSDKSGAAMRSIPLGYYSSIDNAEYRTTLQAKITHDTPDGIAAALAVTGMAYFVLNNKSVNGIELFVQDRLEKSKLPVSSGVNWTETWHGEVGAKGWMSVRAALTAISLTKNVCPSRRLHELVKRSIDFGGDVDTVAIIAVGATAPIWATTTPEIDEMIKNVKPNCHGLQFLTELEKKFMSEYI